MATSDYIKQGEVIRAADIIAAFDEKADQTYVDNTKAPINMVPSGTTESNTIPANTTNPLTTILQTIINNLRWIFNNNLRNVANVIYPVGSIYMSVISTNPGTLFGGTWTAWGMGRTIIGMGTSSGVYQSNGTTLDNRSFNTVEATGGNYTHTLTTAEMPSHSHTLSPNPHSHSLYISGGWEGGVVNYNSGNRSVNSPYWINDQIGSTTLSNQNTGGGGSHNNLPPYITCYFFKRTAYSPYPFKNDALGFKFG
jgi:microcystin-dependent protein